MYSSLDVAQRPAVIHQRPDAAAFDVSPSFNSFVGASSSRPTTSGSEFSSGSAESIFGFPSDPTSPSMSPTDDLSFGHCSDASLVKMETAIADVDLASWSGSGFFSLDPMGGFDTFGNIPQC
jgi:hypothetical protein